MALVLLFGLRTEVDEPERVDLVGEWRRREVRSRTGEGRGGEEERQEQKELRKEDCADMSRNEPKEREAKVDEEITASTDNESSSGWKDDGELNEEGEKDGISHKGILRSEPGEREK